VANEKHEVLLRLKAVELLAYWEGRLVTNRLMAWFGISRQQASSDIKRYINEHNPASLFHDPAVKGYIPTASFQPVLTKGHINEYLDILSGFVGDPASVTLESEDHFSAVQLQDRAVRPDIFREILRACRTQSSVKIHYASMANPIWSERVISPHTVVYSGFRWHVRAYCHKRSEFRDFILSRIEQTPELADNPSPEPTEDQLWVEKISLSIVPNPKLSGAQKALVEKDFGMTDGMLHITVRKALAHYTLQRYQAAITDEEMANSSQYHVQLMESDRKNLYPYLFGEVHSAGL
jgi:predicted DNA-binding transcriptional regulator YafY